MTKEQNKRVVISFLKWQNEIAQKDPMRLETDQDDIADMFISDQFSHNNQTALQDMYRAETGKEPLCFPFTHGENGYATWEYQLWLEASVCEEKETAKYWHNECQKLYKLLELESKPKTGINGSNTTDLRTYLLKYPDQEESRAACLHYLGDSVSLNPQYAPFQICPVCNGTGLCSSPLTTSPFTICTVCNGQKIISQHIVPESKYAELEKQLVELLGITGYKNVNEIIDFYKQGK
jgi:hypothetical protein